MDFDFEQASGILKEAQRDPARLWLAMIDVILKSEPPDERQKLRAALEASAIPHWINEKILAALLDPPLVPEADGLLTRLRRLNSFEPSDTRGPDDSSLLRGDARRALREYLHRENRRRLHQLASRAYLYFAKDTAPHARLEALYHSFIAKPDCGNELFLRLYDEWHRERRYEDLFAAGKILNELLDEGLILPPARKSLSEGLNRVYQLAGSLEALARSIQDQFKDKIINHVFVCYAHEDNVSGDHSKRWLDRLQQVLKPFARQAEIVVVSDKSIKTGESWHEHLQSQLRGARAAILLVSPAFLASDYIANNELPVILQRAKDQGLKVFPILIRPSTYDKIKFKYPDPKRGPDEVALNSLQAANPPSQTLSEMNEPEQDRVFEKLVGDLLEVLDRSYF
jgi:hypothetical protein